MYWSDSHIKLHWLTMNKKLKKFIKNSMTEINSSTDASQWGYYPTKENPFDL